MPRNGRAKDTRCVGVDDLFNAWSLLDAMTVSLDQIGSMFTGPTGPTPAQEEAAGQALLSYMTELERSLNAARMRLREYMSDEEAEAFSESGKVPYWEYGHGPYRAGQKSRRRRLKTAKS